MKKVATTNRTNDAVVVCAASIKMRSLDWLWPEHLLRGSQELLSGLPDLGKSQVQISYVACATAGLPWPNGAAPIEPVNTIMLTAEDTLDQTGGAAPSRCRCRPQPSPLSQVHQN